MIYFYWQDGLEALFTQWIEYNILNSDLPVIGLQSILMIALIPTILFVFALYKTFTAKRFTNYQVRVQQVMFIMFLAALGSWWVSELQAPFELLVFVPSFAFFIIHFIFQFRRKIRAEMFTLIFTIALLTVNYAIFFQNSFMHNFGDFNELTSTKTIYDNSLKGKSVMILGGKTDLYMSAESIATRFYSPHLSDAILTGMNEKEQLITLYEDIEKHSPEVIVDYTGFFQKHINEMNFESVSYYQKSSFFYVRHANVSSK